MTKIVIPDAAFGGHQSPTDWDKLMDPARNALEALIAKGDEMADRIEELEAEAKIQEVILESIIEGRDATFAMMLKRAETAEAKLEKAVEALEGLLMHEPDWPDTLWINARATLAEIKGESHD